MSRFLALFIILPMTALAGVLDNPITLPLYEGTPPNHQDSSHQEIIESNDRRIFIRQVTTPTIEVRLPAKGNATGHAVVICPGGGYRGLSYDWEGIDVASRLNGQGIAAIILKSRLPDDESNQTPHLSPLLDAKRALRIARHNAEAWGYDSDKIGIMGFSAGGHLASTLGTSFDAGEPEAADPIERHSSRPDFMILLYPVISMRESFAHSGSRSNLLGNSPSDELLERYSNETQVSPSTPPTLLIHSSDDESVPVENSIAFYQACLKHGVETEMHLYPYGGHGFSLAISHGGRLSTWPDRCLEWIKELEL
ncbi:alpha/beta hydrolase [Pelagicoccus mobilis]|uniref:Alpha/beta hydrolase n=1 Tax=Pelagicoccus mobilis TaxID=415221 RepID=A0A934VS34_9BACT|nr:alpha/beta hydrolase [Pelagicoccus mobilis]MBK1878104.1 alpha/beta hydrolase [Pelagicoccus mobilis]